MRRRIIRDQAFEIVAPFRARRIYPEKLASRAGELVLGFHPLMIPDLERAGCLTGGRLLYAMWPGYLDRGERDIRAWCAEHGVDFSIRHVSGHAYVDDLKRLVEVLTPERVVPIHTEAADRFANLFPNVRTARDGEWWEV
jgi:ribonuclease J